jgi:tRNA threonylcarbamoyladenosine biosynthesis protein TsaE
VILVARSRSAADTQAVAGALAELVRDGDVLLLAGELGAGKTTFTQGLGGALGVREPITSPTYTLAAEYEGRLGLHHLDVYRLDHLHELDDLGLAELLDEGGITVIEWGEAIAGALPADYLVVRFEYGDGSDDRRLELELVGTRWTARERALTIALSGWLEPC